MSCLPYLLAALSSLFFLIVPAKDIKPPVVPGIPSITDLMAKDGAMCTNYLITTEDGYLIFLHRMGNNTGPPVLLQHGLLNAADIWLGRNSHDDDLPVLLLRQGYDVYLGNFRGNVFNPGHVKYKRSDPRFWDFSFHEHGCYDITAAIDWILRFRGTDKLYYAGHSLGTTAYFVMASMRPEYNRKIKAAMLMAPVSYAPDQLEFPVTFLRVAIHNAKHIYATLKAGNFWELFPRTEATIRGIQDFCGFSSSQNLCLDLLGVYIGEHRTNLNRKTIGYELSFSPAGTSPKTLVHLAQIYKEAQFKLLNYGPSENLWRYNRTDAPAYPLEKITSPVALFWSYNDNLISERSVGKIIARLPNVIRKEPIRDPKFTHADYFTGINAKEVLYNEVIDLMNRYR